MEKEKETNIIFASIRYTETGYIETKCGNCQFGFCLPDLMTGEPYEYQRFCPKCGIKIVFSEEKIATVNLIGKIITKIKEQNKPKIIYIRRKIKEKKVKKGWRFWTN